MCCLGGKKTSVFRGSPSRKLTNKPGFLCMVHEGGGKKKKKLGYSGKHSSSEFDICDKAKEIESQNRNYN